MVRYAEKLKKNNPEKYEEFKKKNAERARESRLKLKKQASEKKKGAEEKLNKIREQTNVRVKKHRAKTLKISEKQKILVALSELLVPCLTQTSNLGNSGGALKVKMPFSSSNTRKGVTARRTNWRISKAKYRENLGPQKRRRVREKDRDRKRSASLEHKSSLRAARQDHVVTPNSPSSKKINLNCVLGGKNRKTIKRALERNSIKKGEINRKKLQDRVSSFYKRPDISRQLPSKRFATKAGPGFAMQVCLKAAYNLFVADFPRTKIGFTKFTMLRPKNVRLISVSQKEYCLCVYCVNIKYKLLCLNRIVPSNTGMQILDENSLIEMLLCPKSDGARYFKPECLFQECMSCKDYAKTIRNYYQPIVDKDFDKLVSWNHWERQPLKRPNGSTVVRRQLITKTQPLTTLIEEFIDDVCKPIISTTYVRHIFNAQWQYKQYENIKKDLPEGWVLTVVDFAKNRSVFYQDEIKEAFFGQAQITIHPIVMYYKDKDLCELVRDVLIIISEDRNHDHHAVKRFLVEAESHLKKNGVNVMKQVIFSDGCSAQYKGSSVPLIVIFMEVSMGKVRRTVMEGEIRI